MIKIIDGHIRDKQTSSIGGWWSGMLELAGVARSCKSRCRP
jgi:hypothetical protein